MSAVAALLHDGRLHLQHGPIDCVCRAWGEPDEVRAAYRQAAGFFATVLDDLCAELPLLRSPLPAPPPRGAIARAMHTACMPFVDHVVTSMAAVAGAVADAVLAAMVAGRDVSRAFVNNGGDIAFHLKPGASLRCGLIADISRSSLAGLHDRGAAEPPHRVMAELPHPAAAGVPHRVMAEPPHPATPELRHWVMPESPHRVMAGVGPATRGRPIPRSWVTGRGTVMTRSARTPPEPDQTDLGGTGASQTNSTPTGGAPGWDFDPLALDGTFLLSARHPGRGLATSGRACKGRGGRSFSFGIADSVSVLARTAAEADAAATIIGNAVDLPGHPAIDRRPACEIDPDNDLGERLVTCDVGPLDHQEVQAALDAGVMQACILRSSGLIMGAVLTLRGSLRICHPSLELQEIT